MSVSVIIPHYGPDDLLAECVASLDCYAPDVEQVIVDGNERNLGFAGNCNVGARKATGDTLVFLNNDCQIHEGWLNPLVEALDSYPIAGSMLYYPTGQVQHAGVNVMRLPTGHLEARNVTVERPSGEVQAVTGASLAINADLFFQVSCFDEGYWNGYEDIDLCLKVMEHSGRRCWLSAESTATHYESASGAERWVQVEKNVQRLQTKWAD